MYKLKSACAGLKRQDFIEPWMTEGRGGSRHDEFESIRCGDYKCQKDASCFTEGDATTYMVQPATTLLTEMR